MSWIDGRNKAFIRTVDKEQVAALRDAYRRKHLLDLAPDNQRGGSPKGEWTELVGSSYDRTIHGFQVDSTPAQDQRFIAVFNDRRNVGQQVARSLVSYGKKHPEIDMSAFTIPEVAGSIARSHAVDGVAQSLIESKKYLLPMVFLAPESPAELSLPIWWTVV